MEFQKPALGPFLHAAAQSRLGASECIVVEDAAAGIEAAQASGFRSVGMGPRECVGKADVVFPSLGTIRLTDILDALESKRS